LFLFCFLFFFYVQKFDDPIRTKQDVVTAIETYLDLYGALNEICTYFAFYLL
jgi:hypothetical protein